MCECGVERVSTRLNATGTDSISYDCGKMLRFARIGVHLCLLYDAGGV